MPSAAPPPPPTSLADREWCDAGRRRPDPADPDVATASAASPPLLLPTTTVVVTVVVLRVPDDGRTWIDFGCECATAGIRSLLGACAVAFRWQQPSYATNWSLAVTETATSAAKFSPMLCRLFHRKEIHRGRQRQVRAQARRKQTDDDGQKEPRRPSVPIL